MKVHCRAAGGLEALDDSERLRVAEPPGDAVPEESVNVGWDHRLLLDSRRSPGATIRPLRSAFFSIVAVFSNTNLTVLRGIDRD